MSDEINGIVEQVKGLESADRWELLETLADELRGDVVLIYTDREAVINHAGFHRLIDLPETIENEMMCEIDDALVELVYGSYLSIVKNITKRYIRLLW